MPFGLVTAWNKRRRSKSQDHSDPCMFFNHSPFSVISFQFLNYERSFSGVYKPVEYWQLDEQSPSTKRRHASTVFTLKEMEEATCSFSESKLVGKGGFGRVYRGTLRSGEV